MFFPAPFAHRRVRMAQAKASLHSVEEVVFYLLVLSVEIDENHEQDNGQSEQIGPALEGQIASGKQNRAGKDHGPHRGCEEKERNQKGLLLPVDPKKGSNLGDKRHQGVGDLAECHKAEHEADEEQ